MAMCPLALPTRWKQHQGGQRLAAMETARQAEINAENALKAARDAANQAGWEFHDAVLGAKDQVISAVEQ